jgi:hypothetical protein
MRAAHHGKIRLRLAVAMFDASPMAEGVLLRRGRKTAVSTTSTD